MCCDTTRHDTRLVYICHILERHDLSTYVTSERHETVDTRRVMCCGKSRHDSRLVYILHFYELCVMTRHDMTHDLSTYVTSERDTTCLHTSHLRDIESCVVTRQNMTHDLSTYVTSERHETVDTRRVMRHDNSKDMTHDLST